MIIPSTEARRRGNRAINFLDLLVAPNNPGPPQLLNGNLQARRLLDQAKLKLRRLAANL
jgi:hypothetical protein